MKATNPWITYRTRFLVNARQLTTSLSFTDSLGRQHSGRKGDYLVESSDGILRIAPRQIFEDIYVPLQATGPSSEIQSSPPLSKTPQSVRTPTQPETPRQRENSTFSLPPNLIRKSPQPDRSRRTPSQGVSYL
jgi:hypothetical protein